MLIEFDETAATPSEAVDRLQELDRLLSKLHAVQADLLVTAASPETEELEVWVRDDMTEQERRLLIEDPIRDELAAGLRRSSLAMQRMIDTARWLAGPLRPTWQALHDGRITMCHVHILEEAARDLPEELLREFQEEVAVPFSSRPCPGRASGRWPTPAEPSARRCTASTTRAASGAVAAPSAAVTWR